MLGKLSKLSWGKQNTQATTASVPATPPAPQKDNRSDQFTRALLSDTAEKKRLAACPHVKDTEILLQVCRDDASAKVRDAAARQFARSLPSEDSVKALLDEFAASPDNKHLAILITAHHGDAELRSYGLTLFTEDKAYRDIAVETRFHDTRDQVTDKITSLQVVDDVWRKIKAKDKLVARKLKQRLQVYQAEEKQRAEQQAQVSKILEEMDKLANGAWSPNYIARYDLFVQRWQALGFEIDQQQQQQFNHLNALARTKVEKNREQQELQDTLERDTSRLDQIVQSLHKSELAPLTALVAEYEAELTQIRTKWQQNNHRQTHESQFQQVDRAIANADKALSQAKTAANASARISTSEALNFDDVKANQKILQAVLNKHQGSQSAPAYTAGFPSLLRSLDAKLKQLSTENSTLKSSIQKQFGSLNSAISASKWGPAKSIYERLEKKISKLPSADRIPLAERLANVEKRLNELGDWKQFATEPKLKALCEEMEKLPSHNLSPKDQADRIKDLQNQWKAMGASPAQEKHWTRFKAAADIAFEPCAQYFAKRRKDKEIKLEQRESILTMLDEYTAQVNWDNPDWRLVEKTIRTAKNEWGKLRVYDRKATAAQEASFTKALAALNDKLAPAYEHGTQEKEALIERVRILGEGDINQHCINQVKRLQSQWRRTGIVERADDQRLWKAFNQACSAIYDVHRGKKREQYAASVEHVKRAREIIKLLRQATDNNFDEKKLQQLQEEFQSLPEFPERDQKFLFRDYNRALDGLDKQRELNSASALKMQLQRLRGNAAICDQLETLAGQTLASADTQISQLLDDWDEGNKTDNLEWKKAINLRRDSIVAHLQAGTVPDFSANTLARKLLCIDLEILQEKETPAEDRELRMSHQLNQLQQGMTSATVQSKQEQLQALEVRWLTAFPAEADQREKLNARFTTALTS